MSINYGRCGDDSWRPPPPPSGRPTVFHTSPFRAVLTPTIALRLRSQVPDSLWLGLLTKAPNLDGLHWVELSGGAYEREPLILASAGLQYRVNREDIVFRCGGGGRVTHLGVFDDAGQLCYYGACLGATFSAFPPADFRINAGSLKAKVLHAA